MKLTKTNGIEQDGETIKGHWQLSPDHEIHYKAKDADEEIKLRGILLAVEPGSLVVGATVRQEDQRVVTGIFKLTGTWKADADNTILFEVERESGRNDVLTFGGAWEIGKNHEILYHCQSQTLKTKTKQVQTLVFKGFWDISQKHRLVFYIGGDTSSALRFRGAFQTKSILAQTGQIRYQLGLEVCGKKKDLSIVLFGKWKLSKALGLSFEIEYENGQKRSILFGGEYRLDRDRRIVVSLKNIDGRSLGSEIVFTREFFGQDAEMFLRLCRCLEETKIEGGIKLRF